MENITVSVFGPTDTSFVDAAGLYVYGLFGVSSTSTSATSTTTSATTSSTSSSTQSTTISYTTTSTTMSPTTTIATVGPTNSSVLINANDDRPSAKTIGAAGVIVIAVVVSSIVYIDGATLIKELTKIPKNYKRLKKRLSKRSLIKGNVTPVIDMEIQNQEEDRPNEQASVT